MADFKPQPRERNLIDLDKFQLFVKNDKGRRAMLKIEHVGNHPRITVYPGDPEYTENFGRLQAKLDIPRLFMVFEILKDLARSGDGATGYTLENTKEKFVNNKPSGEFYTVNMLKFGRDADGSLWIAVVEKNAPKVKFTITGSQYHVLKNNDGSDLSPRELSKWYVLAWAGAVEACYGPVANQHYVPPKPRDDAGGNRGGNGGGGFNRGGQGGGGGNFNRGGGGGRGDDEGGGAGGGAKAAAYDGEIDEGLWG